MLFSFAFSLAEAQLFELAAFEKEDNTEESGQKRNFRKHFLKK